MDEFKLNPFEHYEAYAICAKLTQFIGNRIDMFTDIPELLKDIGIDCTHITTQMNDGNLHKMFIILNSHGNGTIGIQLTNRMNIYSQSFINGMPYFDNDSIVITCVETDYRVGYGCEWVEVDYNDMINEINEWERQKQKEKGEVK